MPAAVHPPTSSATLPTDLNMTAQVFSLPEGDLRRAATESKRVRDHNEKWALGFRNPKWTTCGNHIGLEIKNPGYNHIRPALRTKRNASKAIRVGNEADMNKLFADTRTHFTYVVDQVLYDDHSYSESSTDSDSDIDRSEAVNYSDVFYSFDAPTGPSQGTDILGAALANAVQKFETKETEKMAREYEFVAIEESTSHHADGYTADDDDFELISRADL